MLSKKFLRFSFLAMLLLGAALSFGSFNAPLEAASTDNLSGYAWSETIGWISFNCTNSGSCGTSNYGVNVASSGAISGYAWAETVGWISFNASDTSGCPSGPCAAIFDSATGEVTGWARALAQTTGFDGWIHLGGSNYGVNVYNGCDWSDYAWGSDVIGWIHFAGTNYGVLGTGDACTDTIIEDPGDGGSGDPLSASCSPSPTSAQTNETVAWTADVSGGSGSYAYLWSGDPPLDGMSSNPANVLYGTEGTKTGSVTVSSGLELITVDCSPDVTISGEGGALTPSLEVSCSADPTSVAIDDPVSWEAEVLGGTGNYAYDWSGDIPLEDRTTNPVNLSYGTSGNKIGSVAVSSGLENSDQVACSNSVTVASSGETTASGENPAAELFIEAVPRSVLSGNTTKIYWEVNHARRCSVTGSNGDSWTYSRSTDSGIETSNQITETTVYTLVCQDRDGDTVTDQAAVILSPQFEEF